MPKKENLNQYPRPNKVKDPKSLKKVVLINGSNETLYVDLDGYEGTVDDVITLGPKAKEVVLMEDSRVQQLQREFRGKLTVKYE